MDFIVLWWISILTVILGAILAGLGIAAVVGLGWLLWRYLPALGDLLNPHQRRPTTPTIATRTRGR